MRRLKLPARKKLIGILTVVGTVALSLLLVSIPTETMLNTIGAQNAYLFVFLIALLGSITTFASIPYPLILISLVSGGLNPVLAGGLSALGVIASDSCTFFAAQRGRALLPAKFSGSLQVIARWIEKYPRLFTPCLILYSTFSPLSNDFAVISLSLMKYSFWRVIPRLAIGNLLYNLGIAFLGVYAYDWIVGLF